MLDVLLMLILVVGCLVFSGQVMIIRGQRRKRNELTDLKERMLVMLEVQDRGRSRTEREEKAASIKSKLTHTGWEKVPDSNLIYISNRQKSAITQKVTTTKLKTIGAKTLEYVAAPLKVIGITERRCANNDTDNDATKSN